MIYQQCRLVERFTHSMDYPQVLFLTRENYRRETTMHWCITFSFKINLTCSSKYCAIYASILEVTKVDAMILIV